MRTAFLVLLGLCLVAGLGPGGSGPVLAQSRTEFRMASNEDIQSLDPAQISIAGDRLAAENIYSGLVTFQGGTTKIVPDLAESWTVSPDGKIYTFRLRRGVQFHKGFGEFTASDVKFTIEYHLNPATRSRERLQYVQVQAVETPDPYTARVILREPSPPFLGTLAWQSGFMMSEKAVRQLGREYPFKPVGTGPYMFESYVPGEEATLVANEQYFRGAPSIKRVTIKIVPEDIVSINAILKGELDAVAIRQIGGFRQLQRLTARVKLYQAPSGWQYWAYVQTKRPPTNDAAVRTAIYQALNINGMIETLSGLVEYNPSVFNPLIVGYTKNLPVPRYNPEAAKRVLGGLTTPIKIIYSKAHLYEEYALMVKDQLSQVTKAEVELVDRAIFGRKMADGEWNIGIWAVTRLEADQYLSPFLHSQGPANYSKYTNPKADTLIEEARTATDPVKRQQLHVQLQRLVAEELPIITLGTMRSTIATRPNVEGIEPHPYVGLFSFYPVRLK